MTERVDTATRLIETDPGRVYAALIDPAAIARWMPPTGMSGAVLAFEPWPGGAFRMRLTYRDASDAPGKTDDASDLVDGRFVSLTPQREMVQDFDFVSDDPAFAGTMRMTWTLAAEGKDTRVTVRCTNVPVGIDHAEHETALNDTLANLADDVTGES